jgi:hypothetical protein
MFAHLSNWSVILALTAITLSGTVGSLLLQRMFGNSIALAAVGPVICVLGVFLLATSGRNQKEK